MHPGVAGHRGIDDGNAGGGRHVPLGACELRGVLGIPGGLVELERVVFIGRSLRGSGYRLPEFLFSLDGGMEALPGGGRNRGAAELGERARNSDGGSGGNRTGDSGAVPGGVVVRGGSDEMASQSVCAVHSAARACVPSVWRRVSAGIVAVLGIRADVYGSGGSGPSAAELSTGTGDRGAALGGDVLLAHDAFPGGARQLAGLEDALLFGCRAADRRTLAGILDDVRGDGDEHIDSERNRADQHADAVGDGERRVFAGSADSKASEIRNAVDRDHRIVCDLRAAGLSDADAATDGIYVVANWRDDPHGAGRMEAAATGTGDEETISNSVGTRGIALCSCCAGADERCGCGG